MSPWKLGSGNHLPAEDVLQAQWVTEDQMSHESDIWASPGNHVSPPRALVILPLGLG